MSGNQLEDKIFFEAGHTLGKWNCLLEKIIAIIWLLVFREIIELQCKTVWGRESRDLPTDDYIDKLATGWPGPVWLH